MASYFIDNVIGDNANDGLDNVGLSLSGAVWAGTDAASGLGTPGVPSFASYTWSYGDVIYITGSDSSVLSPGLYEIESKIDDYVIRLASVPTLPECQTPSSSSDTGVTTSSGPMDDVTIINATSGTVLVAGDTVWIRKTATDYSTMMEPSTDGAAGGRIRIIGYDAYPGDTCLVPFSSVARLIKASGVSNYLCANLAVEEASDSYGVSIASADRWVLWNVKIAHTGAKPNHGVSNDCNDLICVGVEVSGYIYGVGSQYREATFSGCSVHDCEVGFVVARGHFSGCKAYANSVAQIKLWSPTGTSSIERSVIDGRGAAIGILQDLTPDTLIQPIHITDSVIMRCTTGLDPDSTGHVLDYVKLWANTSDYAAGDADVLNAAPTGDPLFVDADGGDYRLHVTSPLVGAGANGANIGWDPTVVQASTAKGCRAVNLGMQT